MPINSSRNFFNNFDLSSTFIVLNRPLYVIQKKQYGNQEISLIFFWSLKFFTLKGPEACLHCFYCFEKQRFSSVII